MARNQILGLDVGTETIRAVVAEPSAKSRTLVLRGGVSRPAKGFRRGVIVDAREALESLSGVLAEIGRDFKPALRNIYLGVNGTGVKMQSSRGIIAVSHANSEIYRDDVNRVIQASEAVTLPANRMLIHTLTKEFIVDGVGEVSDPLGMTGSRLEVVSFLIDAFEPAVKNLVKCVEAAKGSVSCLIFSPLASALAVLTKSQRELGVLLIDIGYQTTGLAVYEENKLIHAKVLGVGGGHVTSDLAVALKIPVEAAEKIKLEYGYASARDLSAKETIDLKKISPELKGAPSRKFVAEVIESRLSEICDLINDELKSIGRLNHLPGGAQLTGGGAKLPGLQDLFRTDLKLSVGMGLAQPSSFEAISSAVSRYLEDPEYAAVLGLILWSQELPKGDSPKIAGGFLKKALKTFLP